MKFKRFLSLTLSVLLVLGAVPAASLFVGAASATYDIADTFDDANSATVNGESKSAAEVFELKTMTADGINDYSYEDGKSIADFIADGGLSVPYSTAANTTTGVAAAVNFVKLKDSVVTDRQLQSYYVDFDATKAQVSRDKAGLGLAFAFDSATAGYKLVQYMNHNTQGMQKNLYRVANATYAADKNGWDNIAIATNDVLTVGTTYYYRTNFAYTYNDGGKVSKVTVTFNIYGSDTDRENSESPVATNTASVSAGSNGFTSDMTPCFAFVAGTTGTNSIKNVVINYSKTAEEIAADEAAENANAAEKFVTDYGSLLEDTAVTEENAQQFVDAYTAFSALADGAKELLANYNDTNYADLVTEKYNAAVPLLPTEASTAFKDYYTDEVADLTEAEGKLDVLNAAIVKYNAVEDTHKAQFASEYAKISALLDSYFIKGNTVVYAMTDDDKATYPEVYNYFKNTVMTTADTNGTAKHVDFNKFNSRRMKSVTVAFKYDNNFTSALGFGIIPEDIVVPEGVTTTTMRDYFVKLATRAKYPVDGSSVYVYQGQNYTFDRTANNPEKSLITKDSSYMGNQNWTYDDELLKATDDGGNYKYLDTVSGNSYKIKGNRIVFKVEFDTVLTTANGFNAVKVIPTSYQCFMDNDGNNEYTEDTDLLLRKFEDTFGLFYKYANDKAPLPYIQLLNDASIDNLLYFSTESEISFADKYVDVLTAANPDADEALAMYAAYNELSASDKAIEDVEVQVEETVTKAGLRPATNGATLRADGTMNMGFYGVKPSANVTNGYISRFGILLAGYQNMVEAGVKELKLGDTTTGSTVNAVTYSAGDTVADNILLALNGINVTDTKTWGTKVVARVFVEYTVDGKTVPVYSVNADNGVAKPSNTDGVDQNGVCIRNVNGMLKALAAALYGNKDTKGDTLGLKVGDNATYEGKKLSENSEMLDSINTNISGLDRTKVFEFLCAYRKAF